MMKGWRRTQNKDRRIVNMGRKHKTEDGENPQTGRVNGSGRQKENKS